MSGLCGWSGEPDEGVQREALLGRMSERLTRYDRSPPHTLFGPAAALLVAGNEGTATIGSSASLIIGIWGQPRWNGRPQAAAGGPALIEAIGSAYRAEGARFLEALCGSFAIALIDQDSADVLLATDRLGIHPIVWNSRGKLLVFGTGADLVSFHPRVSSEIDTQAIYNYVYFHMVPAPGTVYRGQQRLLPGQFLHWHDGKADVASYWEMRYVEDRRRPFSELRAEFLESLRAGVRHSLDGRRVGTFLSGGTDSSTVAGLLGDISGEPARTFSIGFDAQGYDEMDYARIAARHFSTHHTEYYVTPRDVVEAIPEIAAAYDQPFGNSSAVPALYCARLARSHGIERLLGGDGGDELFGGNARYATQALYSLYSDLPPVLRRAIEPLAFLVPSERGPVGKVQRYIRHASIPMPERYDLYNLLERLGPRSVFTDDFLAGVDIRVPVGLMAQAYAGAHAGTQMNRMLATDLRFTLADNDLPKVSRTCELAGLEVRYPLLDDAVVEFSAKLEPRLKLRGTRLRYFFKQALRGFLPDAILAKKKHGFGLPFGVWFGQDARLRAIVMDSLEGLKSRRIVRAQFIDELMGTHLVSHPGYFGTMAWVLMMLEQWHCLHRS